MSTSDQLSGDRVGLIAYYRLIRRQTLRAPAKAHTSHTQGSQPSQAWAYLRRKAHNIDGRPGCRSTPGLRSATGHGPKTAQLWDTVARQRSGPPLFGHTDRVVTVAFSPDQALLATGSDDGTVRLWDVARAEMIHEPLQRAGEQVHRMTFSPDGRVLAAVTGHHDQEEATDHVVRLWDTGAWKELGDRLVGHSGTVDAAAFSPDSRLYATGGHDGLLRLRILPAPRP